MRVGIVLGGGAVKGAYQIGFLKALLEHVPIEDIKALSCSSIGIINGYALVSKKVDKAYEIWKNIDFESPIDFISGVWKDNFYKKVINALAKPSDKLEIPLYCSICFLPFIKLRYYKLQGNYEKKWYNIIRGGTFFPLISGNFRFYHGQLVVDGGMMDNVPLYPLAKNEELDLIFVLHFQAQYKVPIEFRNKKTVIIDLDVSSQNQFRKYFIEFNNKAIQNMLESGYEYGHSICNRLFANGRDLDNIRNAVSEIYVEERQFRKANPNLSWVTKLNYILAPFKRTKKAIKDLKFKGGKHGTMSSLWWLT